MTNESEGWTSAKAAQYYVHVQADMAPGRRDVLSLIAAVVADGPKSRPRVLDLGCGHGEVAAEIRKLTPEASLTLVDVSDEMLRRAGQRFGLDHRTRMLKHNLNRGIPAELQSGRFDAVVSCFAIHHVELENRVPLYRQIRSVLDPGGVFINGDRFSGESPAMAAWELDRWVDWMVKRAGERFAITRAPAEIKQRQLEMDEKLGDKPKSIWAMRDDLKEAGFAHVDCLYKNQVTAVIVALR